ncbi:Predicted alpha/beta hydrolase [Acinetobacter marinus]|uniref:Predicted alpha/beta hydrolase n=1 Tax=Acinetobacter marinus TaxID=281375 RepID=A0A1G6JII5_9GAMM|nr:alpha/beta fold hydrolase [Acinetobacter marinus]SDC18549.1 Predicted alpha/beta hydrolase [Acinetobacter marinus]
MFEKIQFTCADGYVLQGRFFPKQKDSTQLPILIGSATGIKQGFYQAFATWLSEQGYDVMTFDFRGIGDSLYEPVAKSKAFIHQWGQLDLVAAIDKLCQLSNVSQIHLIGHSAGGQLLGLAQNYQKVKSVVAVAGSSGNTKGLGGKTKFLGPIMFNVIFPVSSFFKGYAATHFIGMGENLPKGVGAEWREYCNKGGYATNAIGKTVFEDFHSEIRSPITAVHALDDEIATKHNVQDLLRTYPNSTTKMISLAPKQYGLSHIGHMAMFKPSHQQLWSIIADQLHAQPQHAA